MSGIVAIVGRPNVGKSTFFNRLIGQKKAIVDDVAGTTRDRQYGSVEWQGREFTIADTGGFVRNSDDVFEEEIRKQVMLAISEADVIVFLVDVVNGITDLDEGVAEILRKSRKKVFLVVNKVDNTQRQYDAAVFYSLGLGELFLVSSISGSGTGEILDELVKALPPEKEKEDETGIPRFAIVGRPNVGKSSLVNVLVGEERNIVTPIAGTTRDSVHARYQKFNHDFILIDTAGLRKKGKVEEDLEFYSVLRSIRSLEEADVCILMLDATRGIEAQDLNIFHLIQKNKKGIVIVVNKWDLAEKETNTAKQFEEAIYKRISPYTDIPIVFSSTVTKQRIHKVLDTAMEVYENRKQRIPTHKLNDIMLPMIEDYPPPAVKGKYVKIKYVTQLPTPTPQFVFFCNLPQYVKEPYKRYLENRMREQFNFNGVPIIIYFRPK
jgi:GTPase